MSDDVLTMVMMMMVLRFGSREIYVGNIIITWIWIKYTKRDMGEGLATVNVIILFIFQQLECSYYLKDYFTYCGNI